MFLKIHLDTTITARPRCFFTTHPFDLFRANSAVVDRSEDGFHVIGCVLHDLAVLLQTDRPCPLRLLLGFVVDDFTKVRDVQRAYFAWSPLRPVPKCRTQ